MENPRDISVKTKFLRHLIDSDRLSEAFNAVFNDEKMLRSIKDNIDWYITASQICEVKTHYAIISVKYFINHIICL